MIPNGLKLLTLIKPSRHEDHRGFFAEIYNQKKYKELGLMDIFVQDNHSISLKAGTLRGLHFQAPPFAQSKLVRCGYGSIFDVAVDIRQGSPTYGHWESCNLSFINGYQLYIPVGFAHGFITLEPNSEIVYKCSDYYSPESEHTIMWNDPDIGIDWPNEFNPILSQKDKMASFIKDLNSPFIFGVNS